MAGDVLGSSVFQKGFGPRRIPGYFFVGCYKTALGNVESFSTALLRDTGVFKNVRIMEI